MPLPIVVKFFYDDIFPLPATNLSKDIGCVMPAEVGVSKPVDCNVSLGSDFAFDTPNEKNMMASLAASCKGLNWDDSESYVGSVDFVDISICWRLVNPPEKFGTVWNVRF